MAVTTLYMSSLDKQKRTFTEKKLADELDKKLELAEEMRVFLESKIEGIDETMAEDIGMLIADNKDLMMQALKGKPALLNQDAKTDNVASIDKLNQAG